MLVAGAPNVPNPVEVAGAPNDPNPELVVVVVAPPNEKVAEKFKSIVSILCFE